MALSPDDRKAFSLKIASADQEVDVFTKAKAQLAGEVAKIQKLDDANKNIFDPVNAHINLYQQELGALDGITRTTFAEQNIQDSGTMKIGNYFFPNNTAITVPSLSGSLNVWTKPKPFALTYAIGKSYTETQGSNQKEGDLATAVTNLIAQVANQSDIQNTTGLKLVTGSCSNPTFTDQATCELNGGAWTPGTPTLVTHTTVVTLKNNLISAVNALKTFLQTEVTYVVTDDKDSTRQTQNNAAINNINNVIIAALNTWLAYPDFNTTGVNAGNFNTINPNTLAPTKLHSTEVTALSSALSSRTSFIATRISQLTTVLGTISQDLSTGEVTSSGLYGKRYSFLLLRLDLLNGSLSKLSGLKNATNGQDSIIASIKSNKATYSQVVPTSLLSAPGNDTAVIQLVDASFLSPGDTVYVMAENQQELQRAVKSINGRSVVLNDVVPAKYKTTDRLRLYKDIS